MGGLCDQQLTRRVDGEEAHLAGLGSQLGARAAAVDARRLRDVGALELAGNLPSFADVTVHPTINVDQLDPQCALPGLVLNQPRRVAKVDAILNNSFGMLGINSTLIVRRFVP